MKTIAILVMLLSPFTFRAQQPVFDSLRKRAAAETNDTEKVRLLVQLGNKIKFSDTAEAWRCQRRIDSIAATAGNDYFKGQAFFLTGTLLIGKDNFSALDALEKSMVYFSQYPGNKRAQLSSGSALINAGLVHYYNNDYAAAVDYFLRAEQIYLKENPFSNDLAALYSNLSMAYSTLNKPEEALEISKKGIDFARKGSDKQMLSNALFTYGGNLVAAKKGDSGLKVLDSAKKLAVELHNDNLAYMSDFMKAMYYYNNKMYEEAISNYTVCLRTAIQNNFATGIGSNYLNIAACEAELKRTKEAAAHLDSSAKYLDYSEPSEAKMEYFENYAQVYRLSGKYDKAFAFKDSVTAMKDSIYQRDNLRQMEFRQARYNYDAKQLEVVRLENDKEVQRLQLSRKNTLNVILAGGAAVLILVSFLGFRNFKQKQVLQQQRISELETEKKLAATEAVLKGEEQERTRLAKDLHDGLGGMLSGIKYSLNTMKGNLVMTPDNQSSFERSIEMLDSSIREMRRVAHNMMPEALVKFGLDTALRDFCSDINQSGALKVNYQSIGLVNETIEQTTAITIYRIVQELINNTIKHAKANNAIVQVSKTDGILSVTVEDDGKGFDTSLLRSVKGIGWGNIENRVEFLKGKLDVHSEAGKGTSVLIELNV